MTGAATSWLYFKNMLSEFFVSSSIMWVLICDAGTVQCSGLQGDCKGSAQVVMQPHSVGCETNFVKDKSLPRGFPAHIWLGRKIGLYGSLVGQEISFVHSVCKTVCCR